MTSYYVTPGGTVRALQAEAPKLGTVAAYALQLEARAKG